MLLVYPFLANLRKVFELPPFGVKKAYIDFALRVTGRALGEVQEVSRYVLEGMSGAAGGWISGPQAAVNGAVARGDAPGPDFSGRAFHVFERKWFMGSAVRQSARGTFL